MQEKIREAMIENKKKTGIWKEYDDDGQLNAVGKYENGKKVGEWLYYYDR